MNNPNEPSQPSEPQPTAKPSARARRRRARRTFFPKDPEGRAAILATLSRRAYPSVELFIYSLLCGAVIGLGFILDSQIVLVLGILFAPLMTPWIGLTLATISGTPRLFFQTLAALLISALLVFSTGLLAGLASRIFLPLTFNQAFSLSRLWLPDLAVLALGAILLTTSFIRSESKPYLPSVIVAYELFLPLSASGFGLGNGIGDLWPHGMLVFIVHLSWASIFGLLTLALLRFRPLSVGGYGFAAIIFILTVGTVIWLITPIDSSPTSPAIEPTQPVASATRELPSTKTKTTTPRPSQTKISQVSTETESSPEATSGTVSPVPLTLEGTLPVTETRTTTPPPEPTPIYALIRAREGGGAYIRKEPGGNVLATLENGSIVQVLPETQDLNGALWIQVVAVRNEIRVEGWIVQAVLETATPIPNWEPSETPSPTS